MDPYIGILGGVGYKATVYAYEQLNQLYEALVGKGHTCPVRLLAIDFNEINELLPHGIVKASEMMAPYFEELDQQDVIANLLINNTLHEALDLYALKNPLQKPIGHVGILLREKLTEIKASKVMIIGSKYTMNAHYLPGFVPEGIQVIKSSEKLQDQVDELRKVFYERKDETLAKDCYQQLVNQNPGVDHFIVACTELSIAFAPYVHNGRIVDTIDLQCEFAIRQLISFT